MSEKRAFGGGSANTPPFPRESPMESSERPAEAGAEAPPGTAGADREPAGESPDHPSSAAEAAEPLLDDFSEDTTRARTRNAKSENDRILASGSGGLADRAIDEVRGRAERTINEAFSRVADRLEDASDRISLLAEEQLAGAGPRAQAGAAARATSDWLDDVAAYFRTADVRAVQADLEQQVREKPIPSLLIAVGAGWLLGKIMR